MNLFENGKDSMQKALKALFSIDSETKEHEQEFNAFH